MARAKRTDRADARRRYRLAQDGAAEANVFEGETAVPNVLTGGRGATPAAASGLRSRTLARSNTPPAPRSFTASLSAAFHRPDVRADIASLPWLLRTRAFLIPVALVVVGVAAVVAFPTNTAAGLFFQLMVLPPAMAPIFIAGFFARRASYLLGFIVAVIDVIGYVIFVYSALPVLSTSTVKGMVSAGGQQELILSAIAIGPLSGILFAAGAAWYRRFLSFSSAQRARARGSERARPKAQASRR